MRERRTEREDEGKVGRVMHLWWSLAVAILHFHCLGGGWGGSVEKE
jgi:hypothetical protein